MMHYYFILFWLCVQYELLVLVVAVVLDVGVGVGVIVNDYDDGVILQLWDYCS